MKTIFIFNIVICGFFCHAQENPWEPKGENPWKKYPNNENIVAEENDTLINLSETVVVENDSTQINEVTSLENSSTEMQLLTEAGDEAFDLYPIGGAFATGFAFGVCFSFLAVLPDVVYISSNSRKERKTIYLIEKDSRYASLNDEKLNKKVKSQIKSKKAFATLGGTIAGGFVQFGIFYGILRTF